MILAYLRPWNKVKVNKPGMNFVDPKQGSNHAKFERPPFNTVHQKANIKVFV